MEDNDAPVPDRSVKTIKRWRRYLANERAEAAVYRDLANRREGEEREILLALATAEARHEEHWLRLLGDDVGHPARSDRRTRFLGFLARRFGSVFVLALAQRREAATPYLSDQDATKTMAADEQIHQEVIRGLAARGRNQLSGRFRAAVFGANDGLVSNLSLVVAMSAANSSPSVVLMAGVAGLLAGALSMGAGEYVSVRSQRELLAASTPDPSTDEVLPDLDVDANELALVYRARGLGPEDSERRAEQALRAFSARKTGQPPNQDVDELEAVGTGLSAAASSFCFFASGAAIPVIPLLFGMGSMAAMAWSIAIVGVALMITGAVVGLLTGGRPGQWALRQLVIGYGAAAITYGLGSIFDTIG